MATKIKNMSYKLARIERIKAYTFATKSRNDEIGNYLSKHRQGLLI